MNKMFKENGLLSEEGNKVVQPLQDALTKVFTSKEVRDMSIDEIRALGANLAKIVGDSISDRIHHKKYLENKFAAMTDDQFESYLKDKHGDGWMFASLTQSELDRFPKLQRDKIENILKESAKHITKFPRNGIRYK